MEGHDSGVRRAVRRLPGDALVGMLLGDHRVPLLDVPGDLGLPVEMRVVDLRDLLHALHELREVLELRPLVVRGLDGDVQVDALFDGTHWVAPLRRCCRERPTARSRSETPSRRLGYLRHRFERRREREPARSERGTSNGEDPAGCALLSRRRGVPARAARSREPPSRGRGLPWLRPLGGEHAGGVRRGAGRRRDRARRRAARRPRGHRGPPVRGAGRARARRGARGGRDRPRAVST